MCKQSTSRHVRPSKKLPASWHPMAKTNEICYYCQHLMGGGNYGTLWCCSVRTYSDKYLIATWICKTTNNELIDYRFYVPQHLQCIYSDCHSKKKKKQFGISRSVQMVFGWEVVLLALLVLHLQLISKCSHYWGVLSIQCVCSIIACNKSNLSKEYACKAVLFDGDSGQRVDGRKIIAVGST